MNTESSALVPTEHQINRIPGTKVVQTTEALPADQRNALLWLHAYYWDNELGLNETARKIGYDGSTLSKVFHGKYEGNYTDVTDAIVKFRALLSDRASINKAPFIKTELFDLIEESCNAVRTYQKMGFIYGESQVGKTECLKKYSEMEEYNHGRTVYVEMPVGGTMTNFCAAVAEKIRISAKQRTGELPLMIQNRFKDDMVLIVDEASRACARYGNSDRGSKTLDFIRSIYDTSHCGVILCGTNIFRDQMADQAMEKFLRQMHRRVLFRRQLPDRPSRPDLNAFAGHYGLPAATGDAYLLQKETVTRHGLGVWLTTLTAAARNATKRSQKMTWEHVIKAHAFLKRLEEVPTQEE